MAKNTAKTNAENRVTIELFGREYELESSLGACKAYADTFKDNVEEPYTGNLLTDMLQLAQDAEGIGTAPAFGVSVQMFGIVWAMARATGSMDESWDEFYSRVEHSPINFYELIEVYNAIINKLGGCTFRLPERLQNAIESNATEEAES